MLLNCKTKPEALFKILVTTMSHISHRKRRMQSKSLFNCLMMGFNSYDCSTYLVENIKGELLYFQSAKYRIPYRINKWNSHTEHTVNQKIEAFGEINFFRKAIYFYFVLKVPV